jgi:chitodextrinase
MIFKILRRINKQVSMASCFLLLAVYLFGSAPVSVMAMQTPDTDEAAVVQTVVDEAAAVETVMDETAAMQTPDIDAPVPLQMQVLDGVVEQTVYASADAYVQGGGSANLNFGAAKSLDVKHISGNSGITREALLAFDLAGINGSVGKAELYIYEASKESSGTAIDNLVYSTAAGWQEGTVTWNTKPAFAEYLGTIHSEFAPAWHVVDVTSYVKRQKAEGQTAGFGIRQEAAAGLRVGFASREAAANMPYLKITAAAVEDQPPVWPEYAQLGAEQIDGAMVRLTWPPAWDPSGIAGYRIYQDGAVLQTVAGDVYQYEAGPLNPGAAYTFKVEAGDAVGNWSQDGPQATVETGRAEVILPASADAHVQGGASAAINFGAANSLDVKNQKGNNGISREAFMKFDLSAIGDTIGRAELYLYEVSKESNGTAVDNLLYSTAPGWVEHTVTWNTKPAYQDYLGVIRSNTAPQWHAVDVTSYVKQQKSAGQPVSFGIRQEVAAGLRVGLASREAAANAPYLKITQARSNEQAPVWPVSAQLEAVDTDEMDVTLSWPAAEDPSGIAGYRVYRNGQLIQTAPGTTAFIDSLTPGSTHTFKVEAGDAEGNWSSDGPYLTVTLPVTTLGQVKHGHVFMSNEPVSFRIETSRPSLSWSVQDLWGEEVASGRETVTGGQLELVVPMDRVGYFTLTVHAEKGSKQPSVRTAPFAVFAPYDFRAVEDSPFGINVHFDRPAYGWTPDLTELIEYAGIKNVRDGIMWNNVERTKGVYTVDPAHEAIIDDMDARSLNTLLLLAYTNKFYDEDSTPYTDEGRQASANYGKFLMEYFGDRVAAYEVYNEFNIEFGRRGNGVANSLPDYYYALLKKTYDTLKQANPDKTVVGMTTASVPFTWLESVFQLGGLDKVDVASVHPYQFPRTPEHMVPEMDRLHNLIDRYNNGQSKPVWITEISHPTHQSAAGVDIKTQADYLVRTFVLSLASGIDKVFWYDLMNDAVNPPSVEANYGILNHQDDPLGRHTPKPAYAALGAMTRQLTGAEYTADESVAGSHFQYKFSRGQEELRVVWAEGRLQPAVILTQQPVQIVDIMGNERTYSPHEGKVYYTLKDEPIYVKGAIEGIVGDETFVWSGERSVTGDDAQLTLTVSYTGSAPFDGQLKVQGQSLPIHANPGETLQLPLTVPGLAAEGMLTVQGQLMTGGRLLGHLTAQVQIEKPYSIQLKPLFAADGTGKELKAVITNHSTSRELELQQIQWTLGSQSGTVTGPQAIAPSSVWTQTIPLAGGLANNTVYPLKMTVELQGYDPVQVDSTANFTPVYHISEPEQPVTVDWSTAAAISQYHNLGGPGLSGTDDLSGTVTLNWDEEKLYITADITDDVLFYEAEQKDMYLNDGFQFGIVRGIPGSSEEWYDSGFARTPAGLQVYHWITPAGVPVGLVEDSQLSVTRNEEQKLTRYEFALPWTELAPINPAEDEVFSFSLLLNENDGTGRRGYLEWGSGIGASKDPKKYRTVQLIKPSVAPGSQAKPGQPVLSHDNGHDTGLLDGAYTVMMNMWYGDNGTEYRLYENGVLIDTQALADAAPAAQTAATVISGRENGVYRYVAELANPGGTTRSAEMTVQVTDAAPGKPVLSSDNWDGDGHYRISMNMWWGTNGTAYHLYENGVLIHTQALADGTPGAQSAVVEVSNKPAGAYEYRGELVNAAAAASSDTLTVIVAR